MPSLRKEFGVAIGAAQSAIHIKSDEFDDALKTITELCQKYHWELRVWDAADGLQRYTEVLPAKPGAANMGLLAGLNAAGSMSATQTLMEFRSEPPQPDPAHPGNVLPVVLVLKNAHIEFERDRGLRVALVQNLVRDLVGDIPGYEGFAERLRAAGIGAKSDTGKFLVALCTPDAPLPPEIRPLFKVIDHELPDEEELAQILLGVIPPDEDSAASPLSGETRRQVCRHARGLTRLQAEGLFAAASVQFGAQADFESILVQYVWNEKSRILNDEGLVTLYQGKETFQDIVGLDGAKSLLKELLTADPYEPDNHELRAKGVACVGPPRCGKSLIAKAAGNETNRPTLMVDVGAWFGGLVGDTEAKTRKGFQILRAHAPCIAVIDC